MTIISAENLPVANKRPNIVVLSQKDFNNAMQTYESGQFLLNENICYLIQPSFDDIQKVDLFKYLDKNNLLTAGNILIQDFQNKDKYLPFDEALEQNIFYQMEHFKELCQYLGAKEFRFKIIEEQNDNRNMNGNIQADIAAFTGDLSAKRDWRKNIEKKIDSHTIFETGKANLEKARALMELGVFHGDTNIISFYRSACHTENRISTQKVRFSLAKNVCKQLAILANIDSPIFKKHIVSNAKLESLRELSSALEVEYEVKF